MRFYVFCTRIIITIINNYVSIVVSGKIIISITIQKFLQKNTYKLLGKFSKQSKLKNYSTLKYLPEILTKQYGTSKNSDKNMLKRRCKTTRNILKRLKYPEILKIIITNILLKTDKPTKINKGHYKCLPRILNIQAFLQKIS